MATSEHRVGPWIVRLHQSNLVEIVHVRTRIPHESVAFKLGEEDDLVAALSAQFGSRWYTTSQPGPTESAISAWIRTMPGDLAQIEALADGILEGRYRDDVTLSTTRVVTLRCGTCVFSREGAAAMGHNPNAVVCQVCAGTGTVKAAIPGYTFMGAKP